MTPDEAMERINVVLAHAWMVRNFLKHADEVQDDAEMLEVHRMIFDYIRAVEPAYQRKDAKEYLHRVRGKLPKLRRQAEFFDREWRRVSTHTNFEMAARSLTGCVRQIEEIVAAVQTSPAPSGDQGKAS
ncbi:MAG TPA: hypothetical protein VFA26_12480 [Gemmataceae bacterium]|nr:hypothetical protein [Gemmataceae bacterium]